MVDQKLTDIHEKAYEELGICGDVEPVMTLCFMSLAVIPEVKLTDMGLFDVTTFFIYSCRSRVTQIRVKNESKVRVRKARWKTKDNRPMV